MNTKSPTLSLRCRGEIAIFSRPEFKGERMSYPVPTPSAMRGVIEAVFWKPEIVWRIERIKILKPIRWMAFRRNEVSLKASPPAAAVIKSGGEAPVLFADESQNRAQRNTVALRDVDYIVEAHCELTPKAAPGETIIKYVEMFRRRLEKGQHFTQPYLGCRECVADVSPVEGTPAPIDETRDLGIMLWDIAFGQERGKPANIPIFFNARMEHGVIEVPQSAEAARASLLALTQPT